MPWVKLDDQFFANPKVIDLSKDAKLLYLGGLTHCAANLTDGALTGSALRVVSATVDVDRSYARELVQAGLWVVAEDGYRVHDYLKYNRSADQVKAEREANTERQRRHRDRDNDHNNGVSNGVTDGVSNGGSNSPPSHPIPSRPEAELKPKKELLAQNGAQPKPGELVQAFCDEMDVPFPDDAGPAVNVAKSLVKRGYTPADVADCTRWLKNEPYWRDKLLNLKIVASQIPDWAMHGKPDGLAPDDMRMQRLREKWRVQATSYGDST